MAPVRLPRYDAADTVALSRVHQALVEEDQHDDWLPDPVHYRDRRQRADASIAAIERVWESGEIDLAPAAVLTVPRERSEPCPALLQAFDERVIAHRVIASMALRLERSILRDKVFGFRFLGARGPSAALFSSPSDGITEVWDAALAGATLRDYLQLVDVHAFNASCRPALLMTTLRRAGARPEETSFLESALAHGSPGLPSIDDAFAYVYNFYLQPVDAALAEQRLSFLRHRDMFFTFEEKDTEVVHNGIKSLQLEPYSLATDPDLRSFVEAEGGLPTPESLRVNRRLPDATKPLLWLALPTANIRITFNLDWTGNAELLDIEAQRIDSPTDRMVTTLRDLFARWKSDSAAIDGVAVQPVMRTVHRLRAEGVTEIPPFAEATNDFARYRRELQAGTALVYARFRSALSAGDVWTASWLSLLVSDLGPLPADLAARVREALARGRKTDALIAAHLRLLLSRCTNLPPDVVWASAAPELGAFGFRTALLAAFYLARRRAPGPWTQFANTARTREPLLVEMLEPFLAR